MKRSCGPIDKKQISSIVEQGERAASRQALVTKAEPRQSHGCAVKDGGLPSGDLALRLKGLWRRDVSRGRRRGTGDLARRTERGGASEDGTTAYSDNFGMRFRNDFGRCKRACGVVSVGGEVSFGQDPPRLQSHRARVTARYESRAPAAVPPPLPLLDWRPLVLRMLSPSRVTRWLLCAMRSRMASA